MSISIPLTKNHVALIDDEDFAEVSKHKWTLKETRFKKYAYRQYLKDGKKVQVLLHRFVSKCPDGMVVDHANGDGLDNRKSNLRVCTQSENLANIHSHSDRKYQLPKGVEFKKGRNARPYSARITKAGVRYNLGNFASVDEAVVAYKAKAVELFGDFAKS